jgi:hypothetical protein
VVKDNELGALTEALNGQYTEPGPGGDPIRNPSVLPTGKNIHALDPQSIPTQVRARACSEPCSPPDNLAAPRGAAEGARLEHVLEETVPHGPAGPPPPVLSQLASMPSLASRTRPPNLTIYHPLSTNTIT